ncbi:MAG TPA: TlpA disulfide reductase family protein [Ktedonobacteraceae bacterium]|nr:TlpA disulfide reductase family protein [Ktedonobacteraceae bacterium]
METVLTVSSIFLWLVVLLNLVLTLALVRRINATSGSTRTLPDSLQAGEEAPFFTARTLNDEARTLADYAGRPLVLLFIAPGCKSCHELLPSFHELQEPAGLAGVELVLVSEGEMEQTRTMVQTLDIRLPLLVAPRKTNAFFHEYKIHGTPSYCSIDEQSKVQSSGHPHPNYGKWKALTNSWTGQKGSSGREVIQPRS